MKSGELRSYSSGWLPTSLPADPGAPADRGLVLAQDAGLAIAGASAVGVLSGLTRL